MQNPINWLSCKYQAVTQRVPVLDNVNTVIFFLNSHPERAASLIVPKNSVERIYEVANSLRTKLTEYGVTLTPHTQPNALCKPNQNLILSDNGLTSENASHLTSQQIQEIVRAELSLFATYREIVDPAFEDKEFRISYVPKSSLDHHNHAAAFRFATLGLEKPEDTTEYPGLLRNRRGPPNTILIFGGNFWHSSPAPGRDVIAAQCSIA
jgi:hypothetical protein